MEIIEFYTDVLKSFGATVTEDGQVISPNNKPLEIKGKKLVLPTRERLKKNDWSETWPFHPMCEDAVMGQSALIHWLSKTTKIALTVAITQIVSLVLETAARPELQEQAKDPKLVDILGSCKGAKASTLTCWNRIVTKINDSEVELLHIALNRGGTIDGEKYHRVCKVHFPMLDDNDDDGLLCGVKVSKTDKAAILGLLRYVLSDVTWVFGSNDTVPYFHSLMSMYASFIKRYNFFAKVLKRISDFKVKSTDWILELNDLRQYLNKIPKLSGNEGELTRAAKKVAEAVKPSTDLYDNIKVSDRVRTDVETTTDDKVPWDETPKEVIPTTTKPQPAGAIKLSDIITNRKPTFEELRSGERASDRLLPRDRYSRDSYDDRRGGYDRYDDRRGGRDEPRGNGPLRLSDLGIRR